MLKKLIFLGFFMFLWGAYAAEEEVKPAQPLRQQVNSTDIVKEETGGASTTASVPDGAGEPLRLTPKQKLGCCLCASFPIILAACCCSCVTQAVNWLTCGCLYGAFPCLDDR